MADGRTLIDQLNEVLESILQGRSPDSLSDQLRPFAELARHLRNLPREEFRQGLKSRLQRRFTVTTATTGIRPEFHTITPYLVVPDAPAMLAFLKQAFAAEETMRRTGSAGVHAEVRIGDSMVMIGGGGPGISLRQEIKPMTTGIHLFVPDTDQMYARALEAGATSLYEVRDMPYGERSGAVRDSAGNEWYIATAQRRLAEGIRSVNVYLHPYGVDRLIDFVKRAFNAKEIELHRAQPGGPVAHGQVRIGDSVLEMGEAHGQWQPMPTMLYLYVNDADTLYEKALSAGATSLWMPTHQPYGDRNAAVADEWGNHWILATHLG
ncbi:MAG: VOC family protein [Acidobacteria bacterium]|nr:VOC family protein [Acidobacteriota bacterium]